MSWRKEACGEIQPTLKSRLAEGVFALFNQQYELEISPESAEHLCEANQILRDGPLVLYANHTSMADAKLVVPLILSMPNVQRVIGPVGMKHFDLRRDLVNGIFMRSLRIAGVHALPVIQSVDDQFYAQDKRIGMIRDLKKETTRILNQPGSLYGIAPEGTRNKSGQLQQANPGLGYLNTYMTGEFQLHYLPVGLIYKNYDDRPRIEVGQPFKASDVLQTISNLSTVPRKKAQQLSDVMMLRLAYLLPEQMKGFYKEPYSVSSS